MKILGINYLSESSISYMVDGKLRFSISEERINRVKNWYGNPIKSINKFLNENKIDIKEIDLIATHGIAVKTKKNINSKQYINKIKLIKASSLNTTKKKYDYSSPLTKLIKSLEQKVNSPKNSNNK